MAAILIVALFPVVAFAGFGIAYAAWRARHPVGGVERFERASFPLYLALLAIPAAVIGIDAGAREHVVDAASASTAHLPLPVWLALGAAAGALLVAFDEGLGRLLAAALPARAAEGRTSGVAAALPSGAGLVALVAAIAVAEECLWRGFLLTALPEETAASSGLALAIGAVSFGVNHYYFGVRNVIGKGVLGAAWGALFLASGSVWVPVAAHLAYDLIVGRGLARGAAGRTHVEVGAHA